MDDWKLQPARDHGLTLGNQAKNIAREGGLVSFASNIVWTISTGLYLKVYHQISIEGRENLPEHGPFVVVANHASHLDTLVLASAMPWRIRDRVFPIAAGDTFFSSSLTGVFTALFVNALPMWRHKRCSHALKALRDRLIQDRCVYILFPEGTRTRNGVMAPFKAGLGMLVAGTDVPVVPCRLIGTYEALPYDRRFPKPTKLRLRIGAPLVFPRVMDDRSGWEKVANDVETRVIALGPAQPPIQP